MCSKRCRLLEESVRANHAGAICSVILLAGILILCACQPRIAIIERDVTRIVQGTVVVGTPKVIEKEVTRVVRETIVVSTPQVVEKEVTRIVEKIVTATPEPAISETILNSIREICQEQSERGRQKQAHIPEGLKVSPYEGLIYVAGQVILAGQADRVQDAIETLELELEALDGFVLEGQEQMRIQLYQITDGQTVELVTCEINELRKRDPRFAAFADPNYHMSPAGWAGGHTSWTARIGICCPAFVDTVGR